ncbi:MAG: protein MltB [Desulfobacteraceae bacterium]|nr:MAG: protein MltB [Desulfobacteraceae bacterium]
MGIPELNESTLEYPEHSIRGILTGVVAYMKNFRNKAWVWGVAVFFMTVLPAGEGTAQEKVPFDAAFESLKEQLVKEGFDQKKVIEIYQSPEVRFNVQGVSRFLTYREAKLNYDQFVSRRCIRQAKQYMEEYQGELKRAEQAYGVDPKIVTAIILVETRLGTGTGNSSVISTLSTIAALQDSRVRELFWKAVSEGNDITRERFDGWVGRKSNWAYGELKALLKYTEREKMDPAKLKGSFAGALGISQFMPSNILAYAKDGDEDGRIDLFTHADAIASVAHYLKRHGWRPGIDREKAFKVVWSYNHSDYYVDTILKISDKLEG